MVLMPLGSAKSTYASQCFPAWYLGLCPATDETGPLAKLRSGPFAEEEGLRMEEYGKGSAGELPRREVMQMLRLKALGWGVRRIAGDLDAAT
jgi:hypothetical protein